MGLYIPYNDTTSMPDDDVGEVDAAVEPDGTTVAADSEASEMRQGQYAIGLALRGQADSRLMQERWMSRHLYWLDDAA